MHKVKYEHIRGVRYEWHKFEQPGEGLNLHAHKTEDMLHTTTILKGEFDILGARAGTVGRPGDTFEWQPNEPHGLVARTPYAMFVNIRLACPLDEVRDYDDPWPFYMPGNLNQDQQRQWIADNKDNPLARMPTWYKPPKEGGDGDGTSPA